MRLRSQILLAACCTSLLCGALGAWLLSRTLSQGTEPLIDRAAQLAEHSVLQQIRQERAMRRAVYEAAARNAHLRAYLLADDRVQLDAFVRDAQRNGADAVIVADRTGQPMAVAATTAGDVRDAPWIAAQAMRESLGPEGDLLNVGDGLFDVFRVPVGTDLWAGHLIAAHRMTPATLDSMMHGLDAGVAVLHGDMALSSFPVPIVHKPRDLSDPFSNEMKRLREHYRVRTTTVGRATVVVGLPLGNGESTGDLVRQLLGVLGLVLLATGVMVVVVIDRFTRPIEQLKQAAEMLARGQLLRTRSLLQGFGRREDELGTLADAFNVAAQRLNSFVATSMRLVRHLNAAASAVERSSGIVASGAAKQEQRLTEVSSTMSPLIKALEQTTQALNDARTAAISLSLVTNATDQAMALVTTGLRRTEALLNTNDGGVNEPRGNVRTASLLQQVASVNKLGGELRETFIRLRDQVTSIKRTLDEAVEVHIREQHQSEHVHRATSDVDRVAKQHAGEAIALRTSAEQLRRDMDHLTRLLSTLDTDGPVEFDETAAASSGYYRPIRQESISSGEVLAVPPSRMSRRDISHPDAASNTSSRQSGGVPRSTTSSRPDLQPIRLPTPKTPPSGRSKS